MSEWKPIETAPKDGTWILLRGGSLRDQRFHDVKPEDIHPAVVAKWATGPHYTICDWFVCDFDDGYGSGIFYDAPTEWALLPAPCAA